MATTFSRRLGPALAAAALAGFAGCGDDDTPRPEDVEQEALDEAQRKLERQGRKIERETKKEREAVEELLNQPQQDE